MLVVELSESNEKILESICREAKISPEGLCEKLLVNFIYEWTKTVNQEEICQWPSLAYLSLEQFQQNHIGYNVCDTRNTMLSRYSIDQCCMLPNGRRG